MAPSKKGGKAKMAKSNPALSNKEKNHITAQMANFLQDNTAKSNHWKTLDNLKKPAAEAHFANLRTSGEYPGGPKDPNRTPAPPAAGTQAAGITGTGTTVTDPASSATVKTVSDSLSKLGLQENKETEADQADEQSFSEDVKAEDLFIQIDTTRTMPQARDPTKRTSSGIELTVDDWDLSAKLEELIKSKKDTPFPIRYGFQEPGSTIFTNRFRVDVKPGAVLHEFEILGIPDGVSRRLKKFYVDTAIEKCSVLRDKQDHLATDYNKTIIAWKDIRQELNANAKWNQRERTWHLVNIQEGDQRVLPLYLKWTRDVDTATLERYVKSDPGNDKWNPLTWNQEANVNNSNKDTVINALNIVVSKCFGNGVFRLGANKFFVEAGSHPLGRSPLVTIRGYFYSIRPGMGHILLNVNACTSAFLQPVTVAELMSEDNTRLFGKDYPSFLTGLRCYIDYSRGRSSKAKMSSMNKDESRIKKICGLGQPCNEQKFTLKTRDEQGNVVSEKPITVANYLNTTYEEIDLEHPELPAVNLGSRQNPSWFAPEKLIVMPYQIYSRAVPSTLMSDMHKVACNSPEDNRGLIEGEGMSKLRINADPIPPHLQTIPITVNPTMFLVQSTTFKNPKITYRNTSFAMDASAQWDLADCQFLSTGSSAKAVADIPYAIIHDKWAEGDHIKAIQSNLERQMSGRGVGQARCLGTVSIHLNKKDNAEGPLRTRLREARKLGVDLVILVLQNKDQEFYSVFKFLADRVFGLQSMMFVTKSNFRKGSWNPTGVDQYVGNIMMKVNLKFGGINHSAETNGAKHGKISEFLSNTLVLGADVTHPSGGALPGCPSIAAVVGSVENTGGKFLGSIRLQGEANKEMIDIDALKHMVSERVSDWYLCHNNTLPANILYYRDGVSDSQYMAVKMQELPQIVNGFNDFYKTTKAKGTSPPAVNITAVVVTKRHHTRFYPRDNKDKQQGNLNCKPGTLVERGVTSPYFTDFYLQSHNGIKGTAKPAHYWLLQNDMKMSMLDLQHLTHNLCHTYVRATRGVSYAAPAYYADRLCERARCYIRDFLAPPQSERDRLDKVRQDTEKAMGLWPPKKFDKEAEKKKTRLQKDQEREALRAKKEAVEEVLKKDVYGKAVARFELQGQDYDQVARDRLLRTMYWM